ncbi:hypothetical protein [Liquorilactobacillus hordei]|uniref:hypothetical protein n=2 Tax=Lactobacillales TaxID=186826 RepID=UPI0039EBBDA4
MGVLVAIPIHAKENDAQRESIDHAKKSTSVQTDEQMDPSTNSEKSGFTRIFDKNGNEVPLLDKNGNEVPIEEKASTLSGN